MCLMCQRMFFGNKRLNEKYQRNQVYIILNEGICIDIIANVKYSDATESCSYYLIVGRFPVPNSYYCLL